MSRTGLPYTTLFENWHGAPVSPQMQEAERLARRASQEAAYRLSRSLEPTQVSPEMEAMAQPEFASASVADKALLARRIRQAREQAELEASDKQRREAATADELKRARQLVERAINST